MQNRREGLAKHSLADNVTVPGHYQTTPVTTCQIRQKSGWVRVVEMDNVRGRFADLANHATANRSARDVQPSSKPPHSHAVQAFLEVTPAFIGYDHLYVHGLPQLATKRLKMCFHPAHIRRVELSYM